MHHAAHRPLAQPLWPPHVSPAECQGWPVMLVVERQPMLADGLAELFEALHIRMHCPRTEADLAAALRHHHPIGVLAHIRPDAAHTLALLARHDPGLPVMVIADPPADAIRAAGDTGDTPLVNMVWLPHPPGMRVMIEFLALAERRAA